ncbi:hypothetical protein IGI04_021843, partial [Brassica rapa subsp. trilocularis]
MTDDGSSFDPNFTPLNTMDFESQRVLGSTLDGGIGSSSSPKASKRKTKTKSIHFTIRGGRKSSRPTQGNGKNKKKIQEEQLDSE